MLLQTRLCKNIKITTKKTLFHVVSSNYFANCIKLNHIYWKSLESRVHWLAIFIFGTSLSQVSLVSWLLGWQVDPHIHLTLNMGTGDLNLGHHAYTARTLSTNLSLQPYNSFFITAKLYSIWWLSQGLFIHLPTENISLLLSFGKIDLASCIYIFLFTCKLGKSFKKMLKFN